MQSMQLFRNLALVICLSVAVDAMAQPNPPVLSHFTNGTSVWLSWNWPAGQLQQPTVVMVEAGSSSGSRDLAVFAVPALPAGFWVSAPPGTYFVRARTQDPSGTSGPSNEVIVVVSGTCAVPDAPVDPRAAVQGTRVDLSWLAAPGATSYVIQVGSVPGGNDVTRFEAAMGVSVIAPEGTYYVRVAGRSACGTGPPSNEITVVVGTGPMLQIFNLPTAVPWSGAPIDEPVCAGVPNTWFYDVLVQNTSPYSVTLRTTIFRVDNDPLGYGVDVGPIVIPARTGTRLNHHFCFVQPTLHRVNAVFVGQDEFGRVRYFFAPTAFLMPRP